MLRPEQAPSAGELSILRAPCISFAEQEVNNKAQNKVQGGGGARGGRGEG